MKLSELRPRNIDNYADESVLVMLSDRKPKVTAHIYAQKFTEKLQLSITKHRQQYEQITVSEVKNIHDRFLIIVIPFLKCKVSSAQKNVHCLLLYNFAF